MSAERHQADRMFDLTAPSSGVLMDSKSDVVQAPEAPINEKLIAHLFKAGCVQFGDFKLTSGRPSPYRLDLAHAQHEPALSVEIVDEFKKAIDQKHLKTSIISPVPSASVPTVSHLAIGRLGAPMATVRINQPKVDGEYEIDGLTAASKGQDALIVDDAGTTGGSILKAAEGLRSKGVFVDNALVLLDREEGATENLDRQGISLHSVFKASTFFEAAHGMGIISSGAYFDVMRHIRENKPRAAISPLEE